MRYSYQLEAKATFAPQSWKGGTPSNTAPSPHFQSHTSTSGTDASPQRTVQAVTATANTSPHLVRYSSSSNLKLSRGREAVGQQQRKGPGIVRVKTPVHLWPSVSSAEPHRRRQVCHPKLHALSLKALGLVPVHRLPAVPVYCTAEILRFLCAPWLLFLHKQLILSIRPCSFLAFK